MRPMLPCAKSLPQELSITPVRRQPELVFGDVRQCPKIDHSTERKYSRSNWRNQAFALTTRSMSAMAMFQQLSPGERSLFQQNLPGAHVSRLVLVVKLASWPTPQIPQALRRL
jgi:hypothetical protein